MISENNRRIKNKQNRERNISHWKLAIGQMKQKPLLLIFVIPIIILTTFIWIKMGGALTVFDVPKIILPVYTAVIKSLGVLIPLVLAWVLIDSIGTNTARKDEERIKMAFEEKELRHGSPILIYKRKDKKTGAYILVWDSHIPLKTWVERQDRIEHHMKEHLIRELEYDDRANDSRIVMCSAKGIKASEKNSPVYDMELENDMENYVK